MLLAAFWTADDRLLPASAGLLLLLGLGEELGALEAPCKLLLLLPLSPRKLVDGLLLLRLLPSLGLGLLVGPGLLVEVELAVLLPLSADVSPLQIQVEGEFLVQV